MLQPHTKFAAFLVVVSAWISTAFMTIRFLQAVEYCVELTDGYAARGLCHVLEVRTNQDFSHNQNKL